MAITNMPKEEVKKCLAEWLQSEIEELKKEREELKGGKGDNKTKGG